MRSLPEAGSGQFGVFGTRAALAAGWTESALAHAVRRGRLIRVVPGAYVCSESLSGSAPADRRRHLAIRAAAACTAIPAAVASHRAAAVMVGLPLLQTPQRPCVTVPPRHTGDARWAHLHRAALPSRGHLLALPGHTARTTIARAVVDVAREVGVDDAVVIGDAALHRGLASADGLERVLSDCAHWPGIRRAREAVARLDGLAESPLESISRLRILEWGLPRPQLQAQVFDRTGRWLARTDFLWADAGVVGEADGWEKYDDVTSQALRREKLRQELLEQSGLIVVRWDWSDLANADRLRARIIAALGSGYGRPVSDRDWFARAA